MPIGCRVGGQLNFRHMERKSTEWISASWSDYIVRSYASLECDAFPRITQIAVCCTLGLRCVPECARLELWLHIPSVPRSGHVGSFTESTAMSASRSSDFGSFRVAVTSPCFLSSCSVSPLTNGLPLSHVLHVPAKLQWSQQPSPFFCQLGHDESLCHCLAPCMHAYPCTISSPPLSYLSEGWLLPFAPQALVETLHKTLPANQCLVSSVSIPTFVHTVHRNMHQPNLLLETEAVSYLPGRFVRGIHPTDVQRLVWALSRLLPPSVALDLADTLLRRIATFGDSATPPAINPAIQPRSPDLRRQRCYGRNRRQHCNHLDPPAATFALMPVAQRRNRNPLPALLYIPASCKAAVEDRTLCPPSPLGMFFSSLPFVREEDDRV